MPTYRLSATAEADIARLLAHTRRNFGAIARQRYEALLIAALRDISADPQRHRTVARPELGLAVRSYHLRHSRDRAQCAASVVRQPRHVVLYRIVRPDLIGIGRVLHDAMEIERHLPEHYGDE